jgi:predicted alpha/beta-hydrolase family hydrolase
VNEAGVVLDIDGGRLHVARAQRYPAGTGGYTVVLLHGAGSGTDSPVLAQLAELLGRAGVDVARLEMPYRVAGRRAPDRAPRLDSVLRAAVAALGATTLALAGRSMGARVACRCARDVGAVGVLALGFPLQPPGGRPSRAGELAGAGVPVLVVQGERDPFGMPGPDAAADIEVRVVAGGDHEFHTRARDGRRTADAVAEAASVGAAWLVGRLTGAAARESQETVRGYESSTNSTAEVR